MKKNMLIGAAALAAVLIALFLSISRTGEVPALQKFGRKTKIVTTIFPQYDFARAIGGDRAEVSMLLRPGADSHSYAPSPQDIIRIQNCDIFIYIGGKGDRWVDKMLDSLDPARRPRALKLIECVPEAEYLHAGGDHEEQGHEHEDEHEDEKHAHENEEGHGHEHRHLDAHIWTSPLNAEKMAAAVRDELVNADPKNRSYYDENFKKLSSELKKLDADYRLAVSEAKHRRIVFGDRFPFRYMTNEYGLDYLAAFQGCGAEGEASAATVANIIDVMRKEKLRVVFHIELSNEKIADAICRETGAKKLLLHSCHNLSREETARGETYISIMRNNLKNLKEALN